MRVCKNHNVILRHYTRIAPLLVYKRLIISINMNIIVNEHHKSMKVLNSPFLSKTIHCDCAATLLVTIMLNY